MFQSIFRSKTDHGKHTDIIPGGYIPGEARWVEYKQYSNDRSIHGTASPKENLSRDKIQLF